MMNKRYCLVNYVLIFLLFLGGIACKKQQEDQSETQVEKAAHPVFQKEGEVTFWKGAKEVVKIDVEIAATEFERAQGLMYRPSMPDSVGMLFIFEWEAPQAFWMKNTIIPLDIIYVDQQKKIVSIAKNAKPYSEESLPSEGNAQYVVEVVAGFTDKYGILVGDRITF
jgi:hypothetical protein